MAMKVRDLMMECKKRPSVSDCSFCDYKDECNWLQGILAEMAPSELDTVLDKIIPTSKKIR